MKRITLFLTVCLGLSAFQTVFAVDSETVRVANKRGSANTVSTNTTSTRTITSTTKQKSDSNRIENVRSATKNMRNSATVQGRNTTKATIIKQRPATTAQPIVNTKTVTTRPTGNSRTLTQPRTAVARKAQPEKAKATRSAVNKPQNTRITRAATLDTDKINAIKSKDYSKCKEIYHECMDEFCANKDTTLRRCACSSRIHEFDNIKKQLSDVEEQMMGFNQRLLTVGLDKEDALAINTATEGEEAYSQTDKSESEKLLQKITKTLNNSGDSKITNNLSAISLDLDIDSAWDSVDSLGGIATTAKSGLALYNAAQPVCVEMAKEVCSDEEMEIAETSYKLAIQNDCNTVSKAYNAQYNKAIDTIHESGALLDMARLNAYQQRNSDDVLTCKRKMLNQLSDSSVCGEDLYKCLDITGQYIDPSTGDAFLSNNLGDLANLLTAPTEDTKWSKVSSNKEFVNFLNSKKMFLETAMEQCKDLADMVWSDFLEDALAQIKLAQNAKLETIKRNCVTLITECQNNAYQSLEEFDMRALSSFSVAADATVNAMCADVQNACISLVNSNDWETGITQLTKDISIDKMLENCMTVGKTCVMQKCNGTSGNFALCERSNQPARRSILSMDSCWQDVYDCVKESGMQFNEDIVKNITNNTYSDGTYYTYSTTYRHCDNKDFVCEVAHRIWGDCPNPLKNTKSTDLMCGKYDGVAPWCKDKRYQSSLLYWLGTQTSNYSCKANACPANALVRCNKCETIVDNTDDIYNKPVNSNNNNEPIPIGYNDIITVNTSIKNYCQDGCSKKDKYGNCCKNAVDPTYKICRPNVSFSVQHVQTVKCTNTDNYYCRNNDITIDLYCVAQDSTHRPHYDEENNYCINGYWVLVDSKGHYFNPAQNNEPQLSIYNSTTAPDKHPARYYYNSSGGQVQIIYRMTNDTDDLQNLIIEYK